MFECRDILVTIPWAAQPALVVDNIVSVGDVRGGTRATTVVEIVLMFLFIRGLVDLMGGTEVRGCYAR